MIEKLKTSSILYIDDEKEILNNAVEFLSFYCKSVYAAKDGYEGLELYKKHKPDIIITDINMPKLNGLKMIRKIREEDKDTKIIIITAFIETNYLMEAVELGLIKYLQKPVSQISLLPVLKLCMHELFDKKSSFEIEKDLVYDLFNQSLFLTKNQVLLTKKELMFLDLLVKNHKRVVKYEELNMFVWQGLMSEDAMRSLVKELRRKLSKTAVKNISGIGYQINEYI